MKKQDLTPPQKNQKAHTHIPSVVFIALGSAVLDHEQGEGLGGQSLQPGLLGHSWTQQSADLKGSGLLWEARGISETVKALRWLSWGQVHAEQDPLDCFLPICEGTVSRGRQRPQADRKTERKTHQWGADPREYPR